MGKLMISALWVNGNEVKTSVEVEATFSDGYFKKNTVCMMSRPRDFCISMEKYKRCKSLQHSINRPRISKH